MNVVTGIIVYIVIWWLVFLMALPFGVKSQSEDGQVEEGTEPGAPMRPLIIRKMLATTGVSILAWGLFYLAIDSALIPLDMGEGF